jgi:hypothetical protein
MEVLKPLAVGHVGLPAGNSLYVRALTRHTSSPRDSLEAVKRQARDASDSGEILVDGENADIVVQSNSRDINRGGSNASRQVIARKTLTLKRLQSAPFGMHRKKTISVLDAREFR